MATCYKRLPKVTAAQVTLVLGCGNRGTERWQAEQARAIMRSKGDLLGFRLIAFQFRLAGIRDWAAKIAENRVKWYSATELLPEQVETLKATALFHIRKTLRCSAKYAASTYAWWWLCYGLKVRRETA